MLTQLVPRQVFFTKGAGRHRDKLRSFEIALRGAGIEKCNLVSVSSILPPGCKIISKSEGVKKLKPGQITFCVLSQTASNEPSRLIAAAIGCAKPQTKDQYGYLSEYHAFGQTAKFVGDYAEDLAAGMLASTLGLDLDENKHWDEQKEIFKISGQIFHTTNTTQSAFVKGGWTTVVAAAVFLF